MHHFTHSEAGYNHKNEDAIAVQRHPRDVNTVLCALADGQGGQPGGAAAAQTAVLKCLESAAEYSIKQLFDRSTWAGILKDADRAVSECGDAGFTTLIGLCVTERRVCGASCGDSAALLITHRDYIVLTERQRKNPPIGSGSAFPIAFAADLNNGSQLLMMSDGVWRFIGNDLIAETCRGTQGQEAVCTLRQLQLEQNAGKLSDDFSILLIQ
jgi:serine/threonine protein phosphatase PrpC